MCRMLFKQLVNVSIFSKMKIIKFWVIGVFCFFFVYGCQYNENMEYDYFLENDFIGNRVIESNNFEIEIFKDTTGLKSFKAIYINELGKGTLTLQNFSFKENWFIYVENDQRIWVYDGDDDLHAILNYKEANKSSINGVSNTCSGGICISLASKIPDKVMDRLSVSLQKKLKEALLEKSQKT